MNKLFQQTGSLRPGRSVFDLSYSKLMTADMGYLYPVMADEVVPGDRFDISATGVLRCMPLVAPILHQVDVYAHYFFAPYRLLWEDWEDFITGGVTGEFSATIPEWPSLVEGNPHAIGSLWDYMGLPLVNTGSQTKVNAWPKRAYNLIYNKFYLDENLQTEVDLDDEALKRRAWTKDYFTSALPWQQRGTAPALPISGTSSAVFDESWVNNATGGVAVNVATSTPGTSYDVLINSANGKANFLHFMQNNEVDLGSAVTFNVADLRLAFQVQKWLERNARAGARYTEFIHSHYGKAPRDERLQRPEYIGGVKQPLIVSEVLQTSASDAQPTPQGNLAGHGVAVATNKVGTYEVLEHGLIMGLLSIMPKPAYSQGINRQWLRETKYDFYFPEFAHLSEQAILNRELLTKSNDNAYNMGIFGYQGRYDELRYKPNLYVSKMRTDFNYWHLGREFDPALPPALNQSFIECNPSKRIFAVPSEPGFVVNWANHIRAVRPLPVLAEPGLIDHN